MKKLFVFILLSAIFFSCKNDGTKMNRRNLIKKKDFVGILTDMHMMDALTNRPDYYRKYKNADSLDLYGPIFEKYGYEKEDFDNTWRNYSKRPDLYLEIYDEVMLQINYKLDKLNAEDSADVPDPQLMIEPE